MKKIISILSLVITSFIVLISSASVAQSAEVKKWKNRQIPEEYNPNLETMRYHFFTYNKRGKKINFIPNHHLNQLLKI